MYLAGKKRQELIEEFGKAEREKIGIGKHQELRDIRHYLSDLYLI